MRKAWLLFPLLMALFSGLLQSSLTYVPERDFVINEDGAPKCLIIVGDNSANADVISASYLSQKLEECCWYYGATNGSEERIEVQVNQEDIVRLESSLSTDQIETHNLILVGGPIASDMVMQLVEKGLTTIAFWESSDGDVIHYGNAFSDTHEVIVVAGSDREKTTQAAIALINSVEWEPTPLPTWSPLQETIIQEGEESTLGGQVLQVYEIDIFKNTVSGSFDGTPFSGPVPLIVADTDDVRVQIVSTLVSSSGSHFVKILYHYYG